MGKNEQEVKVAPKRKGRPPKVSADLWAIPARLDIDPENPVRCLVHFVDGQVRNLDCKEAKAGGDKLYVSRRRGMVVAKMVIPLCHVFRWETMQLEEPQELALPPTYVDSRTQEVPYEGETGQYYVPNKAQAKADFIRHARNNQKDYVKEEDGKVELEPARPLTGETLLDRAKSNG